MCAQCYLRLVDVSGVAVAHGTWFYACLALQVALMMKLFADTLRPLSIQLQRLGRVAQVRAVQQIL